MTPLIPVSSLHKILC